MTDARTTEALTAESAVRERARTALDALGPELAGEWGHKLIVPPSQWLVQAPKSASSSSSGGTRRGGVTGCQGVGWSAGTSRSASAAGDASYMDSSPRDASNGDHQPVPATPTRTWSVTGR